MFVSQVTVTFLLHVEETVMLFCGIVQVRIFKVELAKQSLLTIVFVGLHLLKSIILFPIFSAAESLQNPV